jgi:hypothetical protein
MDLSHWDLNEKFTLHQAACLAAGVDPGLVELDAVQKAKVKAISDKINESYKRAVNWARLFDGGSDDIDTILSEMVDDIVSEELLRALDFCKHSRKVFYPKDDFFEKTTFTRIELAKWFSNKPFKSAYDFQGNDFQAESAGEKSAFSRASGDRSYVSDKLATLKQAAYLFWGNANRDERDTHPKNSTVVAWLVDHGFSQTLADKGATIIRPDWAPTGRKPEK